MPPILRVAVVVLWLAGLLPGGASASAGAKIDPRVWADSAEGGTAYFLVVLQQQADAARLGAQSLSSTERVANVVGGLRQAAQASQPAVIAQLKALGASYRAYWIVNLIAVQGDRSLVEALAARADVAYITSDRAFRAPLEEPASQPLAAASVQPNLDQVNAPALWALGVTGQGIVYADADTGAQWDHPALKASYRGWDGFSASNDYNWWDAVHADISGDLTNPCGFSSATPCDDHGHGTHTLGIGVGEGVGMAPGAKWIACRNMDSGVGRPSTYIECLQFFLAPTRLDGSQPDPSRHADVVSNSYGCPPSEGCDPYQHDLLPAIENLRSAGIFFSASAGNDGPTCGSVQDPPGLEGAAFTVGAVDASNAIASFSSRGPVTADGSERRKPDLVAPGVGIVSSYPGGGYVELSGTSMAAPHVAGGVALLWSAFPALRGDVAGTESLLEESARHETTGQGCGGDSASAVPNNVYGYGVLDVRAAYYAYLAPTWKNHLYLPVIVNE